MVGIEVNRDNLNDVMEMDHVIQVHEDGTVTEPDTDYFEPEVWTSDADQLNPTVSNMRGARWELLNGFSGQWMYRGPIMHPSEYIGGGLADHILTTPGIYVAVVVTDADVDTDSGEDNAVGWAVARLIVGPA